MNITRIGGVPPSNVCVGIHRAAVSGSLANTRQCALRGATLSTLLTEETIYIYIGVYNPVGMQLIVIYDALCCLPGSHNGHQFHSCFLAGTQPPSILEGMTVIKKTQDLILANTLRLCILEPALECCERIS